MKRPPTVYRSEVRRMTRTSTKPCATCGKHLIRSMTAEGVTPEADLDAWEQRPWHCIPCWRRAGRPPL